MCLTASYIRAHAGDAGVVRAHALAGFSFPIAELDDESRWYAYEEKIAFWVAAAQVLGDNEVTRHIGEAALSHQVGAGLRTLLRTLGSPRVVLSNVAKACPKFSTVARMEAVELGRTHAVVTYELDATKQPHRLDCLMNIGLLSVIGPLFGLPLLDVEHDECQVRGAERCVYRVRWPARRRMFARRHAERDRGQYAESLAQQLRALQLVAADLVWADDVSDVLGRIVTRASEAVTAPRHLLAVDRHGEIEVHSVGFSPTAARKVATDLLARRRSDENVLVRAIESPRREYGVLAAFYDNHEFFGEEGALLAAYARNAAAALDVAEALEQAREHSRTASALLDLAPQLAELATPAEVAQKVADAMVPVVGATASVVYLVDETNRLTPRGFTGWLPSTEEFLKSFTLEREIDSVMTDALSARTPTVLRNDSASGAVRSLMTALGIEAVIAVPMRRRDSILGVVCAGYEKGAVPVDVERRAEMCQAIADHAVVALDNARLLDHIRKRALYDELTGVSTRAHFEEAARQALDRAGRDNTPVSLVFVDLDGFKEINDGRGHLIGDAVLKEIGTRIKRIARAGDLVGRLGGDEFALLLWGTGAQEAVTFAERLRQVLERPMVVGPTVALSGSIGIAATENGRERYTDLVRRADSAMYLAKREGRNACRLDISAI
jgi:diguanylate cyclase (GGDEF)-like protein